MNKFDLSHTAGETIRSKSEPAPMSRNSRRRRNFFLEDAEDYLEPVDAFSNPDLDSRVQIFSSEAQVPPEDVWCHGNVVF